MPNQIPITPEERRRALQEFRKLSWVEQTQFYKSLGYLAYLMVLWGFGKIPIYEAPNLEERRQILLAYKILQ